MSIKQVTTVQGQAWDQIAKTQYGTEMAMHKLFSANTFARGTLSFKGDQIVRVPALPTPIQTAESLPPWKR